MRIDLCGKWLLYDEKNQIYEAKVPGCVHTDVIKEDMYWRDNTKKYQWIENCDWTYKKKFIVDKVCKTAHLVFEGLDTYCDIYLNGQWIGHCENMFIPHRFRAGEVLVEGENELEVRFCSPVKQVADRKVRNAAFAAERVYTRRMQCTYGWDWVERLVTCGICRPVYIESDADFGIEDLYVYTDSVDAYGACVRVVGTYKNFLSGIEVEIIVHSPDNKIVYAKKTYVNTADFAEYITISDPQLWFPMGYGEQPLYQLIFRYNDHEHITKFGIRTVRIMENVDEPESESYKKCVELKKTSSAADYDQNEEYKGFILLINGVKIMCMGANYVPVEPFVSEGTDKKLTAVLERAAECGVNMIRVWGGGIFERQHFYNECDRLGIMVTQDFLMACGEYPEEEDWFIEQLRLETAYAAKALRNHPSFMWYHGDNENAVRGCDTDKNYAGRRAAYVGMLPVLNKLDYTRRLLPSSPYGGKQYASKTVGTTHNTQYMGDHIFPYIINEAMEDYKENLETYTARFISEEPIFGAVCKSSLLKMMTEEEIYADNMEMWYHHTKSNPALKYHLMDIYALYAQKVLGKFTNPKDRLFKLQYVQYEQIRISMETCRKGAWFSAGIIYWMLNDCWPAASGWAIIDYYNVPKAAYYSFKRAAKQVISSINKQRIVISNRGMEDKCLQLKCYLLSLVDSESRVVMEKEVHTIANECMVLENPVFLPPNHIIICDLYDDGTLYDRSFFKDGFLHLERTDGVVSEKIDEQHIRVSSRHYVHAVELEADVVFEDNWFSLNKGETRIIKSDKPFENVEIVAYGMVIE